VLLAAVVLKESLQPIQILGAVLIIVGALFGELWGIRQQKVMSESNPVV
jgi:drug/metabolite transporter (DMT)-like permease